MIKILFLLTTVLILASSACASEPVTVDAISQIKISLNGIKVAELPLADIAKLPQVAVKVNSEVRSGPTLMSVIDLVGIVSFMDVLVCGYSQDHSAELSKELTEIDLASEIIFTLDKNTMAIFGPEIPLEYWGMEITDISVISCNCYLT